LYPNFYKIKKKQGHTKPFFESFGLRRNNLKFMKKIFLYLIVQFVGWSCFGQIWENMESGQGDYSAAIDASTKDGNGDVLLCGYTVNAGVSKDILVMKISITGDTLWTQTYNGPGNGMDEALDIVTDVNNFVYITGYQRGGATGTDMVTLKYSPNGQLIWVQSYLSNINTDQTDRGNSIAVDANGNVYVTGQTDVDASAVNNDNFITIKYNSSGSVVWSNLKNGLGNAADRPVKICLDAQNNVYVTGRSFNGFDDDYLTIKYNGSTGVTLWEKLLDRTHHDRPTDMVFNPQNGFVYVTGRSRNINYDYVTVAYNSTGTLVWQAIYDYLDDDRATSICLDINSDVIVTGQSDVDLTTNFNYNITTVKYSGNLGTQIWAVNYVGALATDDIPIDVVSDNVGNVFVLGSTDTDISIATSLDFVVQKITTTGTVAGTHLYSFTASSNDVPTSALICSSNDLLITGSAEFAPIRNGIFCQLSSATLNSNWDKKYVAFGDNSSNSHAITVDNQGNTYVAGYSVGYLQDRNYLLKKINPFGQTLWVSTISGNSTTGSVDEAMSIAMDTQGFIYTCGFVKNSGTSYDVKLVKYNSLGDTVWTRAYDYSLVSASDKAYMLVIDPTGFIYLTGKSDSDPTTTANEDVITQKWDLNGNLLWTSRYNGSNNLNDVAKICVSTSSGVYVAGRTFNGQNYDGLLIKYNASGIQQWVKIISGVGHDEINAMTVDHNENVIVTGVTQSVITDTNVVTIKYDPNGNQLWSQVFNGNSQGTDVGKFLAVDQSNNVVVCGNSDSDADAATLNDDILLLKYDGTGNLLWQQSYSATTNSDDLVEELRINAANEIVVVGESDSLTSNGSNYDFITLAYNASGTLFKSFRFEGIAALKDIPSTMFINNAEIFVSGGTINQNKQRDLVTIKYSTDPNAGIGSNENLFTWNVFPNPSNGVFSASMNLMDQQEIVNIRICDLKGTEIPFSFIEQNNSIYFDASKLPSNVYFLTIQGTKNTYQEKLIIIK
jgi:uncharacterized delta-60 repeat protein